MQQILTDKERQSSKIGYWITMPLRVRDANRLIGKTIL
jgi:hypothetical protein